MTRMIDVVNKTPVKNHLFLALFLVYWNNFVQSTVDHKFWLLIISNIPNEGWNEMKQLESPR